MCWGVGTESLKLELLIASGKLSTTLETYFTQYFFKIALNGLIKQTSIDWHFEVQPAGIPQNYLQ